MSLWWAKKNQLDDHQVRYIEELGIESDNLILGPPGSGKTNILLRRAQFLRLQGRPNVVVLTFSRPLTEFLRTGCQTEDGKELFPPNLILTFETWQRQLHKMANAPLPGGTADIVSYRRALAESTLGIVQSKGLAHLNTILVDECQDLLTEEVALMREFGNNLYFVGDDRQKIYDQASGLAAVRALSSAPSEHNLPFHYRLAPEICEVADRILIPSGVKSLSETQHYEGPRPGRVSVTGPLSRAEQLDRCALTLRDQIRVYGDRIRQGDRLGVIVPRKTDREAVFEALEKVPELRGKSQVMRARTGDADDRNFNPAVNNDCPVLILTAQGAKGLELRAVQWLFSEDLESYYTPEIYYTVVTRAKTSLDIYYMKKIPNLIEQAHSEVAASIWE